MQITEIEWGSRRVARVANADVELVVTLDVGPRILRYGRRGGPNALHDLEDHGAGEPDWHPRGGHRLWVAPEDPLRTYVPDNDPVEFELLPTRLALMTPADPVTGLERRLEIALAASGADVRLAHRVTNRGDAVVTASSWAITMVAPGSTALVPLPARGRTSAERGYAAYGPSQTMSLWPYFRFGDRRLTVADRWMQLRHDPEGAGPLKFGLSNREGWAAAWCDGQLFVKRFGWVEGATYPDGGVNFEAYTDERILDLETLSPMTTLPPGASVGHDEVWTLRDRDLPDRDVIPETLGLG